jgi:hypothetical protein
MAGLKEVVKSGVRDGYSALKTLIKNRFPMVNLHLLEEAPESAVRRKVIEEDLAKANAGQDVDVLEAAQRLLHMVKESAPEIAGAIGVDLQDVETASLTISDVITAGAGVSAHRIKSDGPIEISGIRAGVQQAASSKKN